MSNIRDWTAEYYVQSKELCDSILESNDDVLREIPSLNYLPVHSLQDGQLVRFSGMIQDMYNPELYFESYQVKNLDTGTTSMRSGMYRDTVKCLANEDVDLHSSKNTSSERQTCVMISIPGLNDWARKSGPKLEPTGDGSLPAKAAPVSSTNKRALDDGVGRGEDEPMDTTEPVLKKEKPSEPSGPVAGTSDAADELRPKVIVSKDHLLNFPVPIVDGKACIVKFYNDNPYKLNQVLDIIGFVSLDPMLSALTVDESMDEVEVAEAQTHNPPASMIPRLHAVKISKVVPKIPNGPSIISKASLIRSDLHLVLNQLLFGDNLAADYVICHLISRIYTRKDYLCLGNFPLNITGFSVDKFNNFTRDFYDILSSFVSKTHLFECTLDNLNSLSLVPRKDYDCNRLTSGILQLSDNTHLIIDETKLIAGKISPSGKQNYQAITDLIKFQKISYDFKYYTMEYETDIPVLILSEAKSFVPCVMQVPIKVDEETEKTYPQVVQAAKMFLKDEQRLANFRGYLELMRGKEFKLGDDITDVIQQDFVALRRTDSKLVNADSLHGLIVFARLMSLSYGEDSLSFDRWKQTFEIENERLGRLSQRK
ncbi:mini-chromosome maintenance complex-binding protein [Microplitis mediator]|uniref:mini-chromosome maintenance complex-binding protein n=1 Tax=Microplitis mediator TaxID=375433 RepID=UPI00255518C9|nr:mini-chromosome maintenance complex-binding protein [Microplitis mediator]